MIPLRRRLAVILGVYLVGLAVLLFWPTHPDASVLPTVLRPFEWLGGRDAAVVVTRILNAIANIALFVPFGLLATLVAGRRWWWVVVLVVLVASTGVELFQGAFLPGRTADPADVVSDVAGGLVGAALALGITRDRRPRP